MGGCKSTATQQIAPHNRPRKVCACCVVQSGTPTTVASSAGFMGISRASRLFVILRVHKTLLIPMSLTRALSRCAWRALSHSRLAVHSRLTAPISARRCSGVVDHSVKPLLFTVGSRWQMAPLARSIASSPHGSRHTRPPPPEGQLRQSMGVPPVST